MKHARTSIAFACGSTDMRNDSLSNNVHIPTKVDLVFALMKMSTLGRGRDGTRFGLGDSLGQICRPITKPISSVASQCVK